MSEPATLYVALKETAARRPDALAMLTGDTTITAAELLEQAERCAAGLIAHGIGPGDRFAVQLPNVPEFVVTLLAASAVGAVTQTVHMPYRAEVPALLTHSGAKAIVAPVSAGERRPAAEIAEASTRPQSLAHVFSVGEGGSFEALMATPRDPSALPEPDADAPYLLLYTSGTTASPKGVPHAARGFLRNAADAAAEFALGEDERILSLAPFTHLYGLMTVHMAILTGSALALMPVFSPPALPERLTALRPTVIYAAPAHFAPLLAGDALTADHFAEARIVSLSGAAVPPALAGALEALLPRGEVIQLWGMSELQAGAYGRPGDPKDKRLTTTGRPSPGTSVRVVNEAGITQPAGTEGELEVRGPSVFSGYRNNEAETARAFTADGWFRTGDIAVVDEDGYVRLTGRAKEFINRGGVKYNPLDVENALSSLGGIIQCAIVPVPDPTLGEKACLCVQLAPGHSLCLSDVTAHLDRQGIAKFKWPERLEIFEALPNTPTRKVMRAALAAQL